MVVRIVSVIAYLILAPVIGCLLAGLDRKMSARMQRRVGPPILQPYYDVRKLFEKEKQAPTRFQDFYIIAYLVFLIGAGANILLDPLFIFTFNKRNNRQEIQVVKRDIG